MKTNRLVAGLIALNLLFLGLTGYLWMTSHNEAVESPSAAVQLATSPEHLTSNSPSPDSSKKKEGLTDASQDNATMQMVSPQSNQVKTQISEEEPVSLPLVFQEPDPKSNISDEDRTRWNSLRETFIKAIGGVYQNPDDPQYMSRWEKAKPQVDAQFKALVGEDMYVQLQDRAERLAWEQAVKQADHPTFYQVPKRIAPGQ